MKTSAQGIEAIKKHEGLRLQAYKDAGGLYTIGYGHLIKPGETSLFYGIDEQKAEELLINDLQTAENAVNSAIKVPITQAQFDSLVSLAFNIGSTAFKNSQLVSLINNNAGSDTIYNRWTSTYITAGGNKVQGLVKRRQAEAGIFTGSGIISAAAGIPAALILAALAAAYFYFSHKK